MTPTRVGLHNLAYELHMTVGQMLNVMTVREFADWVRWYRMRARNTEPSSLPPGALDLTTEGGVAALATMFKK